MSFLKKTFGLLAIFSVIPATYAATARPSATGANSRVGIVSTTASRRMPTSTKCLNSAISGTSVGGNTITGNIAGSGALDDEECRTSYDECIRDPEVCGPDFEECTTNILFHAQMPKCTNILMQCGATGINSLFGTSNIGALSTVAEYLKDSKGNEIEVKRYTYPIDSSVMGMAIIGGMHANQFPDAATCSKRYISCLNRDTVCGADFELCTGETEFKKQSLQCESTLARCTSDGVMKLFNVKQWTEKNTIESGSVIGEMITAGADLAANNAVNTCYRVADQCLAAACANNPLRCIAGKNAKVIETADKVLGSQEVAGYEYKKDDKGEYIKDDDGNREIDYVIWTATDVSKFLRAACMDTIGSNKYCQMTAMGKTPSKSELKDKDVFGDVFDAILDLRKERFESKVAGLLQDFDTDAKNKCSETIKSCAMRTCGGGYGSVCWSQVYGNGEQTGGKQTYTNSNGTSVATKTIASGTSSKEIEAGCAAIVNADPYCIYAKQSLNDADGSSFGYDYYNNSVFDSLFSSTDPLGVVAALDASLATNYNDSAIDNMKKQCENVAISCVKSMCGDKYENCYRNRTDIILSNEYVKTGDRVFDASMNKVSGVLDTVVVMGLCLSTVKNSSVCEEHLKIASLDTLGNDNASSDWGAENVRDTWLGSGQLTDKFSNLRDKEDADGNKLCYDLKTHTQEMLCSEAGADTSEPVKVPLEEYAIGKAASGIFKTVLADMELEAQAIYNSELLAQQSACYAKSNTRMGSSTMDKAATYVWSKIASTANMSKYPTEGLVSDNITPTNDLYNSYCMARVSLVSTDPMINEALQKLTGGTTGTNYTRYFSVGDAFTCGSWLPIGECGNANIKVKDSKIDGLCNAILAAVQKKNYSENNTKRILGYTIGPILSTAAALGTGYAIDNGNLLSGLTGNKTGRKSTATIDKKIEHAKNCSTAAAAAADGVTADNAKIQLDIAVTKAKEAGVTVTGYELKKDDGLESIKVKANYLKTQCDAKGTSLNNEKSKEGTSKGAAIGVGIGVGALGLAATVLGTEEAIANANNEEVQGILNELNSTIRCVVGAEDQGGYGEAIQVTLE